MNVSASLTRRRAIGAVGTVARLIAGLFLIAVPFSGPDWWGGGGIRSYEVALGLVGMPAAMLAFQWVRLRFTTEQLQETSGIGFCLNLAAGAVLFSMPYTRDAVALFAGSSLLLAALRGYAGCEVMAISNWLLRRDDQVGCVVFSPLDALESRFSEQTASG